MIIRSYGFIRKPLLIEIALLDNKQKTILYFIDKHQPPCRLSYVNLYVFIIT